MGFQDKYTFDLCNCIILVCMIYIYYIIYMIVCFYSIHVDNLFDTQNRSLNQVKQNRVWWWKPGNERFHELTTLSFFEKSRIGLWFIWMAVMHVLMGFGIMRDAQVPKIKPWHFVIIKDLLNSFLLVCFMLQGQKWGFRILKRQLTS